MKGYIYVESRYVNVDHIALLKEDYDDNTVYVGLSNGDFVWFNGTIDQLFGLIEEAK